MTSQKLIKSLINQPTSGFFFRQQQQHNIHIQIFGFLKLMELGLPRGIICISGPSGSGKKTLLDLCLSQLNEQMSEASKKIFIIALDHNSDLSSIYSTMLKQITGITFGNDDSKEMLNHMLTTGSSIIAIIVFKKFDLFLEKSESRNFLFWLNDKQKWTLPIALTDKDPNILKLEQPLYTTYMPCYEIDEINHILTSRFGSVHNNSRNFIDQICRPSDGLDLNRAFTMFFQQVVGFKDASTVVNTATPSLEAYCDPQMEHGANMDCGADMDYVADMDYATDMDVEIADYIDLNVIMIKKLLRTFVLRKSYGQSKIPIKYLDGKNCNSLKIEEKALYIITHLYNHIYVLLHDKSGDVSRFFLADTPNDYATNLPVREKMQNLLGSQPTIVTFITKKKMYHEGSATVEIALEFLRRLKNPNEDLSKSITTAARWTSKYIEDRFDKVKHPKLMIAASGISRWRSRDICNQCNKSFASDVKTRLVAHWINCPNRTRKTDESEN